jgi:hypothetical protein
MSAAKLISVKIRVFNNKKTGLQAGLFLQMYFLRLFRHVQQGNFTVAAL